MNNIEKFPLRILFWEATLKCNAYCEFCGSRCGDVSYSDELTLDEICTAFKQIADRYNPNRIMINVSGGEPLMRPDLFDIMAYANSLGYSWGLVTNGMFLSKSVITRLKECNLKTIAISIDGLPNTHNKLRDTKNGLETIIKNLLLLKEANFIQTVMVTTVVSKKNISELEEIKKLLCTLPIDVWRICPVDPIGRAHHDNKLLLSKEEMVKLFLYIRNYRRENLPYTVTTSCSHYLGKFEFETRDLPFKCNAGKTVGSILANGDIFVCPNVPRHFELIQGNVRRDDFVDIWERSFKIFRHEENRNSGNCKGCNYFSDCRGDSLHTYDFENNAPLFCVKELGLLPEHVTDFLEESNFSSLIQKFKEKSDKIIDNMVAAQSLSKDIILISTESTYELLGYFKWGDKEKSDEQICALFGHIYRNQELSEEAFIVLVEQVNPLKISNSTHDTLIVNDDIYNQVEVIKSEVQEDFQLIGFVHSHPNELGISMSMGDYCWHRELYSKEWKTALTIILNSQKKQIAAYSGPAANHVELHLLSEINII